MKSQKNFTNFLESTTDSTQIERNVTLYGKINQEIYDKFPDYSIFNISTLTDLVYDYCYLKSKNTPTMQLYDYFIEYNHMYDNLIWKDESIIRKPEILAYVKQLKQKYISSFNKIF